MEKLTYRIIAVAILAVVTATFLIAGCPNPANPEPQPPSPPPVISVTGVFLNKSGTSIDVNISEQLTATVEPVNATNKNVTWSSSLDSVATVSTTGLVTASNKGTASITATTEDGGYIATCTVDAKEVYAGGSINLIDYGEAEPGYWKNGIWTGLPLLSATKGAIVNSLVLSGSDVYAGGYCWDNQYLDIACFWKNGVPYELPVLDPTKSSRVYSIAVSGSDIYAGGVCRNSSWDLVAGYWKNSVWTGLTPLDVTLDSEVISLIVFGSDIYALGGCTIIINNSKVLSVAGYWKNGVWTALPPLDASEHTGACSFVLSESNLYASGFSQNSSGEEVPGYWKNSVWTSLTPMDPTKGFYITSLAVAGGNVYVGGYCRNNSNEPVPGYWKNGTWISLTPGETTGDFVSSLVVSGSDVYAGGYNVPGYWKNGVWNSFTTASGAIRSLVVIP